MFSEYVYACELHLCVYYCLLLFTKQIGNIVAGRWKFSLHLATRSRSGWTNSEAVSKFFFCCHIQWWSRSNGWMVHSTAMASWCDLCSYGCKGNSVHCLVTVGSPGVLRWLQMWIFKQLLRRIDPTKELLPIDTAGVSSSNLFSIAISFVLVFFIFSLKK